MLLIDEIDKADIEFPNDLLQELELNIVLSTGEKKKLVGIFTINEDKIQRALAQFVRSIQSFDSKFDVGLSEQPNLNAPFSNFTPQENLGKQLFLASPPNGGAGCASCHAPPEFDIDPNTLNNGIIGVIGSTTDIDLINTRSPSLRDIVNPDGSLNGPLMHDGSMTSLLQVIDHYNNIPNLSLIHI